MPNLAPFAKAVRRTLGLSTSETDVAALAYANVNPRNGASGPFVDKAGRYSGLGKTVVEDFKSWDTADQIATLTATGLARAATGNLLHHTYTPGGLVLGTVPLGTQTLAIGTAATGLDVSGDQTDNDGYEVFTHFAGATGRPFVVGYDPAFYFLIKFSVANVSGSDTLLAGFRRAEVNNGTLGSYADYAGLGWTTSAAAAALKQHTRLNAGTATVTATNQTLADAAVYQVKVLVSATGVVTFQHDAALPGILTTPANGVAFSFDDGDPVIPFFHLLQGSAADTGAVIIQRWEAGYQ